MEPISNYSQADLEKELITCDFHGKQIKYEALVEIMRRAYQRGLSHGEENIKALTLENNHLSSGMGLLQLKADNIRLISQINDNAAKRFNSFNTNHLS